MSNIKHNSEQSCTIKDKKKNIVLIKFKDLVPYDNII
jgi:hypothetical protein